ncbi:CDP-alcohol phosphatidyltransferase family protein [Terrabacter sp. NPDC080008]|uniref:CDP-alcohol phosphatidyltransferase family protein n=1 Tax=Terrabacter sp. NPDC080008 TaxID=3155176 RepID=UPI00344D0B7C
MTSTLTWGDPPLVGSPRARALRGTSSGGALVQVGRPASSEAAAVAALASAYDLRREATSATDLPSVLEQVAAHARSDAGTPLVLVAGDVDVSPVALLDTLDGADATGAAVVEGAAVTERAGAPAAVRVSRARRLVVGVGAAGHAVGNPGAYAVGVLRVRAADRAALAAALTEAATALRAGATGEAEPAGPDAFDVVLLAAVRAGLPVRAVPVAHQRVRRGDWQVDGAPGSPWQQRLRAASRGNDGVFSMLAIRPLSRRLTAYGLGRDWSPNAVTAVSLALGLAACAAVATGLWWAWLLAAVLLQASLVVDCVDGEIARFTRVSSPLGAWLDAVSDRVKEFAMVAALAWVAARRGSDLWWLAVLVLTVLAFRHVEDHAYAMRTRAQLLAEGWPERPAAGGLGAPDARACDAPAGVPTTVPLPPARRARLVRGAKQVLHLPVAERYLIMSLGLLTMSPAVVLWALGIASLLALGWTQAGRLARAVTGRDGFRRDRPDTALAELCDLAVLPRPSGRGRLSWQVPGLLLLVETAALLLAAGDDTTARAAAYAWLAVVCWRVYDNAYRLRETGEGGPGWLRRGSGLEWRVIVLALVGGALSQPAPALLGVALVLAALSAAASAQGWSGRLGDKAG